MTGTRVAAACPISIQTAYAPPHVLYTTLVTTESEVALSYERHYEGEKKVGKRPRPLIYSEVGEKETK